MTTINQVENPERAIADFIKSHYGRFSYTQDIKEDGGSYEANVGFKIPRSFNDKHGQEVYFKHLDLENIAKIQANYGHKSLSIQSAEPEEISRRIEEAINSLKTQLEQKLTAATANKLVELPGVLQDFSKIRKLVRQFKKETRTDLSDFIRQEGEEAVKYARLLESLGYVQEMRDDEGVLRSPTEYKDSNKLKQLFQDEGNDAYKKIIEKIIAEKMSFVRSFDLNNVLPYVRLLNSYYFTCYQANRLVDLNVEQIIRMQKRYYGRIDTSYYVENKFEDLTEYGLVRKRDGYYIGHEEVFNELRRSA